MPSHTDTDEQVLADPGDYTVDEVLDAFSRSTPLQIADAKELEADGAGRKGISEFEPRPPAPPAPPDPAQQVFSRERLLDRVEGPSITGQSHPTIVGALHGEDGSEFTRAQVEKLVSSFHKREVPTQED